MVLLLGILILSLFFNPLLTFSADDPEPKIKQTSQNFYQQGRDFVSKGKWLKAINSFRKAIEKDNQDYKAYNMLGYSLRQSGDLLGAVSAYNRALNLKENYEEALE